MADNTFWNKKRAEVMRDEILPSCSSVNEALTVASARWKRHIGKSQMRAVFNEHFGSPPSAFVGGEDKERADIAKLVKLARGKPRTLEELCDMLQMIPKNVRALVNSAAAAGYSIAIADDGLLHPTGLAPRGQVTSITIPKVKDVVRLAVVSDLHFGSKYCRPTELADFVKYAISLGIENVLCAGDILDGTKMYRGQEYEQLAHGFDEQADLAIMQLPTGVTWWFISGNHDESFHRQTGMEPGDGLLARAAQAGRTDLRYLGAHNALVYFGGKAGGEGVLVELLHPDGGLPYAKSYKLQRVIEHIEPGSEPQLLVVGHLHQKVHVEQRNIEGFMPCCFQSQTPYLARKKALPVVGGLIVEMYVDADYKIRRLRSEWVKYHCTETPLEGAAQPWR